MNGSQVSIPRGVHDLTIAVTVLAVASLMGVINFFNKGVGVGIGVVVVVAIMCAGDSIRTVHIMR